MINGLFTAATGMKAQEANIAVVTNNISNVNTTGFKKDRVEFQDLMYKSLNYTSGSTSATTQNPTGIDAGLGVRVSGIQKSFMQGDLQTTGNDLDIAIEGKGFFQLTLPNGETAYTKNGAFKVNEEGTIVNANGYALEPQIVIPNNVVDISIGQDGIITATDPTTGGTVDIGQITLADFINSAGLNPLGGTMFQETDSSGAAVVANPGTDQFGNVQQGMIELSNVSLVDEMVNLITAQRAYEANSKSIKTADMMLGYIARMKM